MKRLALMATSMLLIGCGSSGGPDVEVFDCTTIAGTYQLTASRCEDVDVLAAGYSLTYVFNSASSLTETRGSTACETIVNYTVVLGRANIALSGLGQLACRANGDVVGNCTTALNSCDSSVSVDGLSNSWSGCTNLFRSIELTRQTSPTQAANFSRCGIYETEEITLTRQ